MNEGVKTSYNVTTLLHTLPANHHTPKLQIHKPRLDTKLKIYNNKNTASGNCDL